MIVVNHDGKQKSIWKLTVMVNSIIANIIRRNLLNIMEEKNIKRSVLAERMGVSRPHITHILKERGDGKRGIGDDTIEKICVALEINKADLMKGIDTSGSLSVSTPAPIMRISNKEDKPPTRASAISRLLYIMDNGSPEEIAAINETLDAIMQDVSIKKAASPDKVASSQQEQQEFMDCETVGRRAA